MSDEEHYDPPYTGDKLRKLVIDIQAAVGGNAAGATKLGSRIIRLTQDAFDEDVCNEL